MPVKIDNIGKSTSDIIIIGDARYLKLSGGTMTGSIVMPDAGTLGLGTGKALIQFDDKATDFVSFSNCNVGIGTTNPTNILSLGNGAARKFWIEDTATDIVGRALTIAGGSTVTGTSNNAVAGGDLILSAGAGTGQGTSSISFLTGYIANNKIPQTLTKKMILNNRGLLGINVVTPGVAALEVKALSAYSTDFTYSFTGSGVNNLTLSGTYTGSTPTPQFTVVIDGVNTIKTSTLNAGGSGYNVNDTFTIDNGTILATCKVLTVSSGAVQTYEITTAGAGYWVANTFTTTATFGAGTGLKINITVIVSTFKWKKDSESYTENVQMTGSAQLLKEGISVTFATTTGHNSTNNFTVTHTAVGGVAPVDKTVTYGVVATAIGGTGTKYWITQNLGATQQATAATDATEPSAGWYWQFNRIQGFKLADDGTTRTPNTAWIGSITESSDWQSANDPCTLLLGSGWRLPTYTEYLNADAVAGGNWSTYTDTYASLLKLHAAGFLVISNGALYYRGGDGLYWSSTQGSTTNGWSLDFGGSSSGMYGYGKAYGFSVRGVRDDAPIADQWIITNISSTPATDILALNNDSGIEVVRVANSGNVGIGLTSPGEKLSVNGHLMVGDATWSALTTTGDLAIQGNVGIGTVLPVTKLDVAGSMQVSSAVALSLGGYVRTFAEAIGTPSGTTTYFDIAVAVPTGCKLLGAQLRVDTALTAGETWSAAYVTGSTTALAAAGTAVAKNTKINKMHVDEITSATTNIRITRDAGNFTNGAGVIRAIVYYETLTAMGNAA